MVDSKSHRHVAGTLLHPPFPRSESLGQTFAIELNHWVWQRENQKLPVTLKNIHVVDLEAFKAGLDRVEDVLTNGKVRAD